MVQIRQLSSLKPIHLVASFVIGLSSFYHKSRQFFVLNVFIDELSACLSQ